jgi:prepilin-type N-terminal cleavage/methylation domain-containing protein
MRIFSPDFRRARAGFTMVEIAICLAIIGIALVGIIGVLPYGMNTQRSTREETVINQDVATLLPIITQGMRGADDLTNYVYAITNYWTHYINGVAGTPNSNGYTLNNFSVSDSFFPSIKLTNGANIVGLLSTPEYIYDNSNAAPNLAGSSGYSNHIIAYVHSLSGLATEKPPQDNDLMVNDSFGYRLLVVNAPVAMDTNSLIFNSGSYSPYNQQLSLNQRELRMTFYWPLLPNGHTGNEPPLTFRATVAGQLVPNPNNFNLYFYQPQSFGVNTN